MDKTCFTEYFFSPEKAEAYWIRQQEKKGYGTKAESLALRFAFTEVKMNTVYADALQKNARSQHVLHKAGFTETHRYETFIYSLGIIAQPHSKRNKIFILLRSWCP